MSVAEKQVDKFIRYLEYYPCSDEEGYDGIHDGGWKGLVPNAPESAVKQYKQYIAEKEKLEKQGARM